MTNQEALRTNYASHPYHCNDNKPLEIYMFFDPLSAECWALEPILKKLSIEYGKYFTLRHILSGKITTLNLDRKHKFESIAELWDKTACRSGMSCDGSLWLENPISSPHLASIAIKAAELQGRRAGLRFLRKLQEMLFLEKQNITTLNILKACAKRSGLDVSEFLSDIHSNSAAKAFQCDLKVTAEMEVTEIPTLVFFNENIEDEGIKISGYYPYTIYEQIITEMLQDQPTRTSPPPLEDFLKHYHVVASKEVAVVYNKTIQEAERELKKLQLKQIVKEIPAKHGSFWKYIHV